MPFFHFGGDFISEHTNSLKHGRVLDICLRLIDGDVIRKTDLATQYGITERSIQRDIDDLRSFFADGAAQEIIFDRSQKGYRLRRSNEISLTNGEALTVCKILLESRSLRKDELTPILDKVIKGCVSYSNRPQVEDLIAKATPRPAISGQTVGRWSCCTGATDDTDRVSEAQRPGGGLSPGQAGRFDVLRVLFLYDSVYRTLGW